MLISCSYAYIVDRAGDEKIRKKKYRQAKTHVMEQYQKMIDQAIDNQTDVDIRAKLVEGKRYALEGSGVKFVGHRSDPEYWHFVTEGRAEDWKPRLPLDVADLVGALQEHRARLRRLDLLDALSDTSKLVLRAMDRHSEARGRREISSEEKDDIYEM